MRALVAAALLGIAGSAVAAASAPETSHREAFIPFADQGGIRDWEADGDRGLWVQDVHRQWYYAKLMAPCIGLNFAERIGFDTSPLGRFDRFSAIVVPGGHRCTVQSFAPSGAPAAKQDRPANG